MARYNHTKVFHNLIAPTEIVPIVINILSPKSVVDVGCGLGTFLKIFKDNGVSRILGLDGSWCKKALLFQNIEPHEFVELDLEKRIKINEHFDLAISLEVAEHLNPERAKSFVEDLTLLSNTILFSAAIPNQGGENHKNENWLNYWENIFSSFDYVMYDVLKPHIWNNPKIFWWYKQNMVLFVKKGFENDILKSLKKNELDNVIHSELYIAFTDYRQRNSIKRFTKSLIKAVLFKLKLCK